MAEMENLSWDVRNRRWKFIGHIMRKAPNNDCRTALTWTPEGRRKRGRPKTTWRKTAERKRDKAGWKNWSEAQIVAADRDGWRNCVEALCATWHEEDRNKRMQSITNYLIVNMAVSDILITVLSVPRRITEILVGPRRWLVGGILGSALCKSFSFLQDISTAVSVLSLLVIAIDSACLHTPPSVIDAVNKLIADFVWNGKKPKIKRDTLIGAKEKGGLDLPEYEIITKSLLCAWAKRMQDGANEDWMIIPSWYLKNVGGPLIFDCSYDLSLLELKNMPPFYIDILKTWAEVHDVKSAPLDKHDIKEAIIWNNKNITIAGKSVYWENWHVAGILRIKDLLEEDGKFLSYGNFLRKFGLATPFTNLWGLIAAIPLGWKRELQSTNGGNRQEGKSTFPPGQTLTSKRARNILIQKKFKEPLASSRLQRQNFMKKVIMQQLLVLQYSVVIGYRKLQNTVSSTFNRNWDPQELWWVFSANMVGTVQVRSAFEPSDPSDRSLSHFQEHEATRSISTPPLPGWDASPSQGYPPPGIKSAGTHLLTWVERGTMRVKCLAQEHNSMTPARA
ncbi:hypothetical protein ACROYT_G018819 [Oculina patagonica]